VILAGGEGTRLRPLTSNIPKPIVRLVDRPFISFMLEWLRGHGVEEVILSCGFMAERVRSVLGDGSGLGIRLRYIQEPEPRGTAGAVKLAEPMLEERFLMLNGDVLTDIDLGAQLAQHEATGARGTLALVAVADPSAYGLVVLDERRAVTDFVEKPSSGSLPSNLISAGAYVLEREILKLVAPDRNVSIEGEIWPLLVGEGLYGFPSDSYWMDIGTPGRYLQGTFDILEGNVESAVRGSLGEDWLAIDERARVDGRAIPPALIGPGCEVAEGARVGSLVVLGRDVTVGPGSSLERAVVLDGARIGAGCELRDCIVCEGAVVGDATKVTGGAVLGEGVRIGSDNVVTRGARIFPGVDLPDRAIEF